MKKTVKLLSLIMLPMALMLASATTIFATEQVSMTSAKSEIGISINDDATGISIDWGDGTISNTNDGGLYYYLLYFSHQYTDEKSHTIVIRATNLKKLNSTENQLTSLDMSKCTALTEFACGQNQLTSLNISGCTALTKLECQNNRLTSLNVSGCTALTQLYCYNNQLTSLNVSGCTALTKLECQNNQLTSLDVRGCTELKELYCYENQLTSLDVSKCPKLETLSVGNNKSLTSLYCNYDKVKLYTDGCDALALPNPKGTISVNMRNSNSGKTVIDPLDCRGGFYIEDDNFVGYNFARTGKVKGLGNVPDGRTVETGWTDKMSVTPGYGYVGNCRGKYMRIYVVRYLISAKDDKSIIGAEIEYVVD
ncbi:MAG: leucine-rich repeat domain-containing protein [Prevotellaceae bacterium]|jgi:hypothetical protein|nr:leucine-rich repeat domain-containing protein [Prevotellaceae bacterium]